MGYGVLQGIGQGLMAGSQFVQQARSNEATNALREKQLEVATAELDDRSRLREMEQAQLGIWRQYADADLNDPDVFNEMATKLAPHLSAQQVQAMQQAKTALLQQVGERAVDQFLYGNDLSGFQAALDKKMPGAKLSINGKKIVMTGPDGKAQEFADVRGLGIMLRMPGVVERISSSQAATLANEKTAAEIEAQRALSAQRHAVASGKAGGYYDDQGRWVTTGPGGGSRTTSGSGSRSAAGSDKPEEGYLGAWDKASKEVQDWIAGAIGDAGLPRYGPDGKVAEHMPTEQAAGLVAYHLDQLMRSNLDDSGRPRLTLERGRQIALDMARYELGQPDNQGTYKPTSVLNPDTGEWETIIRTRDNQTLRTPALIRDITPEQQNLATSSWVDRMIEDGTSVKIARQLDSRFVRDAYLAARKNPQARKQLDELMQRELGIPAFSKRVEALYVRNILPDLVIPDQALTQQREAMKATRGSVAPSDGKPAATSLSPEDVEKARALGAPPPADVRGTISDVADILGEAWSNASQMSQAWRFSNILEAWREGGYKDRRDAAALVKAISDRPDLASTFKITDEERAAMQYSSGRNITTKSKDSAE